MISTFTPLQHPGGGFGGGHGQLAHVAPTYAAVLSLASVGASALSMVDRRALLSWLHSLKSSSGSFAVCSGGEADVRGVYCALTVISLLRLPTDGGLVANTSAYLASCQTYEGGFAATPNGSEAHGGYTYCALAALMILHPPARLAATVDLPALIRWLSARQYAPEGGLSGRTNKLVDGCYSTWVGACWPLIEACVGGGDGDVPLWSREALVRYILSAAQAPFGGLRDKPGKGPDFYHTAYNLLGYSAAIHSHAYHPDATTTTAAEGEEAEGGGGEGGEEGLPLLTPFNWKAGDVIDGLVVGHPGWPDIRWDEDKPAWEKGQPGDRVKPSHLLFNVSVEYVEDVVRWCDALVEGDDV